MYGDDEIGGNDRVDDGNAGGDEQKQRLQELAKRRLQALMEIRTQAGVFPLKCEHMRSMHSCSCSM